MLRISLTNSQRAELHALRRTDLPAVAQSTGAKAALVAIPSLQPGRIAELIELAAGCGLLERHLPNWREQRFDDDTRSQAVNALVNDLALEVMRGINAAVVGLLLAALYRPVWTSAIHAPGDFALGLVDFLLLAFWKWPPWLVVVMSELGGAVLGRL